MKFLILSFLCLPQLLFGYSVLVRFEKPLKESMSKNDFRKFRSRTKPKKIRKILEIKSKIGLYEFVYSDVISKRTIKSYRRLINDLPGALYSVPNKELRLRQNEVKEPEFNDLWNITSFDRNGTVALPAWQKFGTPSKNALGHDVVTAAVDSAYDLSHRAMKKTWFKNEKEIPGNGKDDDHNGYVDDYLGWNAVTNSSELPKDPATHSHGTLVSSLMSGDYVNNEERHYFKGISPATKVVPIATNYQGLDVATVARAYAYVIKNKTLWLESKGKKGINFVATNNSFGIDMERCEKSSNQIWNDLYNELGKVGVISAAATTNMDFDVDAYGDVPTGCSSPFIMSVGKHGIDLETWGGRGARHVDLYAPGLGIVGALSRDRFAFLTDGGTSSATPHVAGAVAYLHSIASKRFQRMYVDYPDMGALTIKQIIINSVDKKDELPLNVSGGKLNLFRAAHLMKEHGESRLRKNIKKRNQ